jgi:CheY-like chemotaxis protein
MKGKIQPKKNFNVVLVDDDSEDRMIFNEALKSLKLDIDIQLLKNGAEALEYLNTSVFPPDIIFLDLNMPVMGGKECLVKIKQNDKLKNLCIAIYSTSADEEDIQDTLILGANVYLKKPDNFDQLRQMLLKIITFNGQVTEPYLKREFFMLNLSA